MHTALQIASKYMPVLSEVLRRSHPLRKLKDIIILHVNHCLDDVFILDQLFNTLFMQSIFVVVPYKMITVPSNYPGTVYYANVGENGFELLCSGQVIAKRVQTFGEAIEGLVYRALRDAIIPALAGRKKLLLIEDGGYHYRSLFQCFNEGFLLPEDVIGVVEQTMSGAIRCVEAIRKRGIPYPALTIARSDAKMRYEAFFIGRRVVEELAYLLYRYDEFLALRRVLVIGYGIIGRNVALSLGGMACRVTVLDTNREVSAVAQADGYEVLPRDLTGFFDTEVVVIGATGESSFTLSMLAAFAHAPSKRIFLVSASSRRREFKEIIQFFEGGGEKYASFLERDARLVDIHHISVESDPSGLTYRFKCGNSKKAVILIARGFPVNFFRGDGFSLTMSMIDPVNAELALLANYTAVSASVLQKNCLHVLGSSPLPGLPVNEEEILSLWMEQKGITQPLGNTQEWYGFPVHPVERYLRLRCLDDPRIVPQTS
ncbi:Adenosylhomocysteinase [invertebrate metagenome]|uniref:Adenosylhomocysteinase n=1 Tax=invertebrate metagenome TaxID=1711999 RepID=A0A484H521_9ZZZZ